jgi:hypothetical protein
MGMIGGGAAGFVLGWVCSFTADAATGVAIGAGRIGSGGLEGEPENWPRPYFEATSKSFSLDFAGAGNRAGLLGDVIHGYYQDSPFIRFNLYV